MSSEGKIKATYDPASPRIGFHNWDLEALDEADEALKGLIRRVVEESLAIATTEYPIYAWFDIDHCNFADRPQVVDPTSITVELPVGPNQDDSPRWSFSLAELVTATIEFFECGEGGPIDIDEGNERELITALRDSLRSLADQLDAALARPQK